MTKKLLLKKVQNIIAERINFNQLILAHQSFTFATEQKLMRHE